MEAELHRLQTENARLRANALNSKKGPVWSRCNSVPMFDCVSQDVDVENQLRDTAWRLQQLQTQYDYLVSKNSSRSDANLSSEQQIEVRQRH